MGLVSSGVPGNLEIVQPCARKGAPSTNTFPQGACFLSGAREGESEENPQAKRAREGEQAVPEGRYSCEASALAASYGTIARFPGSRTTISSRPL